VNGTRRGSAIAWTFVVFGDAIPDAIICGELIESRRVAARRWSAKSRGVTVLTVKMSLTF
jgi:hypothetical protein